MKKKTMSCYGATLEVVREKLPEIIINLNNGHSLEYALATGNILTQVQHFLYEAIEHAPLWEKAEAEVYSKYVRELQANLTPILSKWFQPEPQPFDDS